MGIKLDHVLRINRLKELTICAAGAVTFCFSTQLSLPTSLTLSLPLSLPLSFFPSVFFCLSRALSLALCLCFSVSPSLSHHLQSTQPRATQPRATAFSLGSPRTPYIGSYKYIHIIHMYIHILIYIYAYIHMHIKGDAAPTSIPYCRASWFKLGPRLRSCGGW